jgi:hypothetical protein
MSWALQDGGAILGIKTQGTLSKDQQRLLQDLTSAVLFLTQTSGDLNLRTMTEKLLTEPGQEISLWWWSVLFTGKTWKATCVS